MCVCARPRTCSIFSIFFLTGWLAHTRNHPQCIDFFSTGNKRSREEDEGIWKRVNRHRNELEGVVDFKDVTM